MNILSNKVFSGLVDVLKLSEVIAEGNTGDDLGLSDLFSVLFVDKAEKVLIHFVSDLTLILVDLKNFKPHADLGLNGILDLVLQFELVFLLELGAILDEERHIFDQDGIILLTYVSVVQPVLHTRCHLPADQEKTIERSVRTRLRMSRTFR